MTSSIVFGAVALVLFAISLAALVREAHLLRKILAMNVMSAAVFLLLVAVARRNDVRGHPDPVPHAMVITGIVVAVSVTALALALLRRMDAEAGTTDPPDGGDSGEDG